MQAKTLFSAGLPTNKMNTVILFYQFLTYLSLFITQSALKMYSKSRFHPLLYAPDLTYSLLYKKMNS
jgi:hypothetical protein